ncbi:phospholipase D-like domain-containing protein [Rhizobium sp. SG741]|uniref:phospholipase D-like domain-containing protein n=1 Tax=Rhizobium sp. SG741 TaxID=2587114 RepID=UPI001447D8FE|nr:phospholipase D-like domain-containing protein [Rhizobium sp. SG741]NKJ03798.1 phosphatidylserine/phosphatidylglycerophosphate/cardiolipin synthase-like enzyme [Rhizobium sp. SG741]
MPAIAFSNNDIALVAWTYDRNLDGCLGFAVFQIDGDGIERALPAVARFEGQDKDAPFTTEDAPIQKFWWKDLFAKRGGTYQYRIVPMGGVAGEKLQPLTGIAPLLSNKITLTEERGPSFKAYFNRGIVATQALSNALNHKPSAAALKPHIMNPDDPIRKGLMGQLFEGVTSLLDRADRDGGEIHAALYELDDPDGLERRLQAADHGDPKSRTVVLGNARIAEKENHPEIEDGDAENRQNLKKAGVNVIDRILKSGSIPHNKSLILSQSGKPTAVMTGSTNWTSSGLCTQTNNALVIESPAVAQQYMDYWNKLKSDIDEADGNQDELQAEALRKFAREKNGESISTPIKLDGDVSIQVLFAPSTVDLLKSPPKEHPEDMEHVFKLMESAKHAVLFLAFDPGNNSILDAAGRALKRNPNLFVRGALTSTQRASNFAEALEKQKNQQPDEGGMHVSVIGEPGKPKKKADAEKPEPDYRSIPAGAISKEDVFGAWEAEMYIYGHAIIHNKIVVIDPFSNDCTVITGSHNLGYRASHNNDENFVIVRGNKDLAQAYACHVLDLYDHYAWRYWLRKNPEIFGRPLVPDPSWQKRYIDGEEEKSPELRFWLSATNS